MCSGITDGRPLSGSNCTRMHSGGVVGGLHCVHADFDAAVRVAWVWVDAAEPLTCARQVAVSEMQNMEIVDPTAHALVYPFAPLPSTGMRACPAGRYERPKKVMQGGSALGPVLKEKSVRRESTPCTRSMGI